MTPEEEKQLAEQIFAFVVDLRNQGKSNSEIKNALIEKGLDEENATAVISDVDQALREHHNSNADGGGLGLPGWAIWILLLVGINILSAIFDWPFWVY